MSIYYSLIASMPYIILTMGIAIVLLFDLFKIEKENSWGYPLVAAFTCIGAATWSLNFAWKESAEVFSGLAYLDAFTALFHAIILFGALCTILLNFRNLAAQRVRESVDIDALILLSAFGGMVMVSARSLILLFLGFELLSVAVYVLTGSARLEKASAEGALKYFILGAFSSAFLLYGMALVYAATGTMNLDEIAAAVTVANRGNILLLLGFAFILFGFAFKVSLAPFHFWAPDVYQGAPSSVVTYMAVVVKAAAFGSFIRILAIGFPDLASNWEALLVVMSALTMTVGNIVALRQRSLKRLLAYSSIAHAGYALIGMVSSGAGGWDATIFYLIVYSLMTVASFGVVLVATGGFNEQYAQDSIDSFRGFGWKYPFLGFILTVALLSLGGFPPLGGFFGKLYLFKAGVSSGHVGLVIIAALNSLVSLYYYLSVLVVMYFSSPEPAKDAHGHDLPEVELDAPLLPSQTRPAMFVLAFSTLATLLVGIFSGYGLKASSEAATSLSQAGHGVTVLSAAQ